jgi:IS1 family transposase/transposase-like protein
MGLKMAMKKHIHQMTIKEWERAFPNEEACCAYLVRNRWPKGVACPRCGATNIGKLTTMPWHWQCYECGEPTSYRFSHITGTVFENTNKPLRDWFRVLHMMLTSKKGVPALQVYRTMGFGSYKTAWYMCHRLRLALPDRDFQKLVGIVELDETYIGGKKHNRHKGDRGGPMGGAGGKIPVVGAVSRTGKRVVAKVLKRVDKMTVGSFVAQTVERKVSVLCTDEWPGYKMLDGFYDRASVDHSKEQYVVGAVHTNTIEGFWSILKRGVVGTYHKVSAKYLPLYVAEFAFRYNNRENPDIFGEAIRGC